MGIQFFENLIKISDKIYHFSTDEFLCSNIYALFENSNIEKSKFILIDTGSGLVDISRKPEMVLLTHNHSDHTKGVKENWNNVFIHENDLKFKKGFENICYVPKNAEKIKTRKLDIFDFNLEIFHTPGHTEGSICILENKNKILFSGDTYFGNGIFGRTDLGGDLEKMKKSLHFISSLDFEILCPGHGKISVHEHF
ncbi:MAG: MBL fold metallo-hydrolase [Candidatus Anstonellales archaeon]